MLVLSSHFGVPNFARPYLERLLGLWPSSQSVNLLLLDAGFLFNHVVCCQVVPTLHIQLRPSADPHQTLTLEGLDAWIHGRLRGSHHLHCQEMRRASSRSLRDAKKSLESLYGGFLRRGDDFMMILCEFDPQIIQVIG